MRSYPISIMLKDERAVMVRPMEKGDLERSHAFFKALLERDRNYLRYDVTDIEVIRRRMRPPEWKCESRLVALLAGEIVGDATLIHDVHGWMRHVGEIRCIVRSDLQRLGLGSELMGLLFEHAMSAKLDLVLAEVLPAQTGVVEAYRRLGFEVALTRKDHVVDQHGEVHDLLIMTMDLADAWDKIGASCAESDRAPLSGIN